MTLTSLLVEKEIIFIRIYKYNFYDFSITTSLQIFLAIFS